MHGTEAREGDNDARRRAADLATLAVMRFAWDYMEGDIDTPTAFYMDVNDEIMSILDRIAGEPPRPSRPGRHAAHARAACMTTAAITHYLDFVAPRELGGTSSEVEVVAELGRILDYIPRRSAEGAT